MAAETGNVPLCTKGTVVGIRTEFIDVIWDVTFIGGTNLGDRCSQYRGLPVAPWTILNLSLPQVQVQLNGNAPPPFAAKGRGRGRGFFTPAPRGTSSPRAQNGPVRILQNNRGRGAPNGTFANKYNAAATNDPSAYNTSIPPSQQARLRNAFTNNASTQAANAQTYENNTPPRKPRQDYSAVPPPATLSSPSSSGAGRIFRAARGNSSPRSVNGTQVHGNASAAVPTEPASERLNGHTRGSHRGGRTRARGRGTAHFSANGVTGQTAPQGA